MIRFLVLMVGIGFSQGAPLSVAQLRYEQGFTAYNGRTYMVPTPAMPCNSASFNDHGMSVRLCVDNFGVPLPPVYPERSPASKKP
ncbi:MAG: hypothetical protein EBX52_08580 [Proteobacteria bacterium]|nr:hypothetical protein [Pseudomonadota bacterium]